MASNVYTLSDRDIVEAAASLERPDSILIYYVELPNREGVPLEFPIKQVVRRALKTKFADRFSEAGFTAHRARDILRGLGFTVRRRY